MHRWYLGHVIWTRTKRLSAGSTEKISSLSLPFASVVRCSSIFLAAFTLFRRFIWIDTSFRFGSTMHVREIHLTIRTQGKWTAKRGDEENPATLFSFDFTFVVSSMTMKRVRDVLRPLHLWPQWEVPHSLGRDHGEDCIHSIFLWLFAMFRCLKVVYSRRQLSLCRNIPVSNRYSFHSDWPHWTMSMRRLTADSHLNDENLSLRWWRMRNEIEISGNIFLQGK